MLSLTRGRVARRLRVLTEIARERVRSRDSARQDAAALDSIREAVTGAGLDPETNDGLRYYRGADRTLASLGDSPQQQQADAAFAAQDPQLARRENWLATAAARALEFIGRGPPEPGRGSPFDWWAWSLAFRSGNALAAAPA
jgi:hypothetical protein